VEFGKANLTNITSAPVTIKFSKAVISKLSGDIKMNLEFCNSVRLNLDNNLSSLDLKTSYSTVNLKPLGSLPASYNISTSFGSFKNTSDVKFSSDEIKDAVKKEHEQEEQQKARIEEITSAIAEQTEAACKAREEACNDERGNIA
jgi:predicted ribosome quality control (RQC) complex YloA/Tae2 family protein